MAEQRSKMERQAHEPKMELAAGTIFRGGDGSVYFIRDQPFDACRLTGEELEPRGAQPERREEGASD